MTSARCPACYRCLPVGLTVAIGGVARDVAYRDTSSEVAQPDDTRAEVEKPPTVESIEWPTS